VKIFVAPVRSSESVPVVIIADLIIIGDQSGWSCISNAAIPAMCESPLTCR